MDTHEVTVIPPKAEAISWPTDQSTVIAARHGDPTARAQIDRHAGDIVDWAMQSRVRSLTYPLPEYIHYTITLGWTPPYASEVLATAKDILAAHFSESPAQTKSRLILALEQARIAAANNNQVQHEIAAIRAQADILLPKTSINVNTTPTEIQALGNMTNEELEALLASPAAPRNP